MAYIYCITNLINGKQYVGKTTTTIEKRFKEHCTDSKKERCELRPLYTAMNKYGIENFEIKQLIECEISELDYYESYYIKELNTYGKTGYNATKGGDGSVLYNYEEIVKVYLTGLTIKDTAKQFGCCVDIVRKAVNLYGVNRNAQKTKVNNRPKAVIQLDINTNEELLKFNTITEAALWAIENGYSKATKENAAACISECCKNKRKSIFKFKWKFYE